MEDVATNLKVISHSKSLPRFFVSTGIANLDGLLGQLSQASYPCLVAESGPDKRLLENLSDNPMFQPFYTFFILYQAEPGNADAIREARDKAESDANLIIGKMLNDRINSGSTDNEEGLARLDTNSFRVQGVGPLGDSAHGVMVSFTLNEAAELYYDDDDWHY